MKTCWTDLAMETGAGLHAETKALGSGMERTVVTIEDEEAARRMGRPVGRYVTISCPQMLSLELTTRRALGKELARTLEQMLPAGARTVMVIGLGNRSVTPDALGPRTLERILVTRHVRDCVPDDVSERMNSVCAAAPGVLGVTGIETAEAMQGLVAHVRPEAVIAVDSLAARSSERICSTIQITDTGITPGSGVGNHRKALTKETLGVPVIAVGVPMVVYAWSIAADALGALCAEEGPMDEERLNACIEQVVSEKLGDMIVTPREVDALVERMSGVLADGINSALHPGLSGAEIEQLMAQ
ncbi:MAG: GPR endopeptidase [Clostridia bacterium]|nr:GPR endopeptidase [Clostridia bacterium]